LTQNDLNAFSRSPLNSAIYRIGTNGNLTIPDNPADPLQFNRNLFLNAGGTLTIERELEVPGPIVLRGSEIDLLGGANSIRSVAFAGDNSFSTIKLYSQTNQDIRIGAVDGLPASETPALDLTLNDLAALQPERNSITIGNLDSRPEFQIGDITVLPDASVLPLNPDIRIVNLETDQGTVQIQREMTVDNLVITSADVEIDSPVNAESTATLQPSNLASTIGIGDTPFGDFIISQDELANLNTTGTITIGNPVIVDVNGQENSLGEVRVRNLDLSGEAYDLTIQGGDIRLFNTNNSNTGAAIRLADNRTLQLVSTGSIIEGNFTDVLIGGLEGRVLFDAARDISEPNLVVQNLAARSRGGGNISLEFPNTATISTASGVEGVSTADGGNIDIFLSNRRPNSLNIDAPIVTSGSGNIRFLIRESSDTDTTIAINAPIRTETGDITIANSPSISPSQDNSIINLGSTVTSDSGNVTFWDPVIAEGGTVTTDTGNITFGDRLSGNQLFAIDGGSGTVEFNEAVGVNDTGAIDPLLGLDIAAGDVTIQASANLGAEGLIIDSSGEVAIADTLTTLVGGQVNITARNTITASAITTDEGAIALATPNTITFNGNVNTNGGTLRILDANTLNIQDITVSTNGGDFNYQGPDNIRISGSGTLTTNGANIQLRGDSITINSTIALDSSTTDSIGGNISLEASNGDVNIGDITSTGRIGGNVEVDASGDVQVGAIATTGTQQGGTVTLEGNTINTNTIDTTGTRQSGDVAIEGDRVNVSTVNAGGLRILNAENVNLSSVAISGGRVDITAEDTITANGITTDGGAIALSNADTIILRDTITTNGGNLRVLEGDRLILRNSATINTETGHFIYRNSDSDIQISGTGSLRTSGGDIRLNGNSVRVNDEITLSTSRNRLTGGDITVRATEGFIRLGDIDTSGRRGGIVILDSPERIRSGTINTTGTLAGGDVVITTETAVTTGNIRANATNGVGGDIELEGDRITTGNLTTTGEDAGGNMSVIAEIAIQTGNIRTRGRIGDGGDVFLDPRRDIEVGFIDARGGTEGGGGDIIAFTERFFRATDTFGNTISISSTGSSPNNNGIIDITHGGGPENPFEVGLLSNLAGNGTVGSITTGADTINNRIISGNFSLGDIQITDLQAVPIPPPFPPDPGDVILPDIEPVEVEQDAGIAPEFNNEFNENATVASPSIIDLGVSELDNQLTDEYQAYDPQIMPPPQSEIWIAHTPTVSESEPAGTTTENAIVNQDISPFDPVEPGDNTGPEGMPQQPGQETFPDNASPNTGNETESPTMNPPAAGEDPAIEPEAELGDDSPASPAPDNDTEPTPIQPPDSTVPLPSSTERNPTQDDSRSSSSAGNTNQRSQVEVSLSDAQVQLRRIQQQTGIKPALVYAVFTPNPTAETFDAAISQETVNLDESGQNDTDQLELLLVTATGDVIRRPIPGTQRLEVEQAVRRFRDILFIENTDTFSCTSQAKHQEWAEKLYQWLFHPLEQELEERNIDTIAFLMDEGLRALPLAALYDGDQYLVERYNIGLMPSLSLTNLEYVDINDADVLAMGASKFDRDALEPLPATEVETAIITDTLWDGEAFMNEAFTYFNLRNQRQETPFGIVHLATHASFHNDEPEQAYIQLSDRPLRLDEIRELGWHNPTVELVVLSACDTAVGDRNTELGFAGFSALAGVKSTLASLWRVSDAGTLGLMVEFYQRLRDAPIKADALREAQLAMLRGEAYIQDGTLVWSGGQQPLPLEEGLPENLALAHPRFWAGFTMVGSPW
jgi:CHAT domain-containing protein